MIKHYIVVAILLGLVGAANASLLAWQRTAGRAPMPESIRAIPDRIVDYRQIGGDAPIDEKVARYLETSTILVRAYENPEGWPVELTIVYAGATRRSLHFPELCLVGAGWEINKQDYSTVGFSFSAKRLVLAKGGARQAVLYWFKTGDKLTGNYFWNALHWARNQVTFGPKTSAMVKVATVIGPGGEDRAFAVLEDFAMKLQPDLMEHVP